MKKLILLALVAVVGGGAAFTALGGMDWLASMGLAGEDKLVRARIEAFWDARLGRNEGDMASFAHPLQGPLPETGMFDTLDYEILNIEMEGDRATAEVKTTASLRHPVLAGKTRTVKVHDKWVKYQGSWYRDVMPVGYSDNVKYYMGKWKSPIELQQEQEQAEAETRTEP